jgi:hypothetical protein
MAHVRATVKNRTKTECGYAASPIRIIPSFIRKVTLWPTILMKGLARLVQLDLRQQANKTYEAGSGLI